MAAHKITTKRLVLRRWIDADLKPFIEMNQDPEVMKYFPKALTETETLEMLIKINLHFEKNNFGLLAVEEKLTKQFIGFTGFGIPSFESFFMPCVEIGWRFRKDVWGKGFATEAAKACLKYGFENLHFEKVVSFTSAINTRSEKVMQRLGMICVANFDHPKIEKESSLCCHVLYAITRDQYERLNK